MAGRSGRVSYRWWDGRTKTLSHPNKICKESKRGSDQQSPRISNGGEQGAAVPSTNKGEVKHLLAGNDTDAIVGPCESHRIKLLCEEQWQRSGVAFSGNIAAWWLGYDSIAPHKGRAIRRVGSPYISNADWRRQANRRAS